MGRQSTPDNSILVPRATRLDCRARDQETTGSSGRDCDNSNLQGKSKKVRVIGGSSKQIAESKGKTSFYLVSHPDLCKTE